MFAAGYAMSESICIFDVNKSLPVTVYPKQSKYRSVNLSCQPNRVRCSQNLIFVGHESRNVRMHDVRKSYQIHEFVAHSDSVTGICYDPMTNQLFTSGHDGNIRIWDIRTFKCLSDLKANRKKYDESIFNIDLYRGKQLASGKRISNDSWSRLYYQAAIRKSQISIYDTFYYIIFIPIEPTPSGEELPSLFSLN